ncbi:MAG TPA: hypothetical protein PK360_08405, partial [bacterium]|nr:hypothetical protein [bacterium]
MAARCCLPWMIVWLGLWSIPTVYPSESPDLLPRTADWGADTPPGRMGQWKRPGHHEARATPEGLAVEMAGNGDRIGGATDEGYFVYTERKGSW